MQGKAQRASIAVINAGFGPANFHALRRAWSDEPGRRPSGQRAVCYERTSVLMRSSSRALSARAWAASIWAALAAPSAERRPLSSGFRTAKARRPRTRTTRQPKR